MKRFSTYVLLSAATVTAAVVTVLQLGLDDAALLAVALSGASGGLALIVKRRALKRAGITAALGAMALMFAIRGVLLGLGLWVVVRAGGSEIAFVAAFFAVFFVQTTLELSWVVAASKEKVAAT
jgi:hypothetical protein